MAAISKRLRYEVMRRDGHRCRYCGATAQEAKLVVDAVTPEALGGSHGDPANLVTACEPCNSGKSSMSPGAPLVADVAADALRWSQAITAAAGEMLARASGDVDACEHFDKVWRRYGTGPRRKPLPKDPGWQQTVRSLLSAGLPMAVLEECVEIAMGQRRVTEENVFRYMCGVAWKKVREIQDRAHEIASADSEADADDTLPAAMNVRRRMARELLDDLTEDEREIALDEIRSAIGDDAELEILAVFAEFHGAVRERRQMAECLRYLLDQHPDGERFLDEAYKHLRETLGVFPVTDLARVAALKLMKAQAPEMAT